MTRASREYVEFVVDGTELGQQLGPMIGSSNVAVDLVPVLVLNWPIGFPEDDVARLTGTVPAPLPDGRVPLYLCAECGDLGCGSVTVVIERSNDLVTWRDFGYQNDYEPFEPTDVFHGVGPFVFDGVEYDAALQQFRDEFDTQLSPE